MFDLGFFELLLIAVVVLLVVGPDRLPGVVTFLGQWIGRIRRMANHMKREIQDELEAEHLKSLLTEQNKELDDLRQEVRGIQKETESTVREATDESTADTPRKPAATEAAADETPETPETGRARVSSTESESGSRE